MLRITIELIPQGDITKIKKLYTGYIVNDGTGTESKGNYKIILEDKRENEWKEEKINNFPRKRKNAWYLLYEGLKKCLDVK